MDTWKIIEQTDDWVMLGHDEDDDERVIVYPRINFLSYVYSYVYPCATCGWRKSCLEGCHA